MKVLVKNSGLAKMQKDLISYIILFYISYLEQAIFFLLFYKHLVILQILVLSKIRNKLKKYKYLQKTVIQLLNLLSLIFKESSN